MISITVPSGSFEERNYVARIVFDCFLGLDYVVKAESCDATVIKWDDKSICLNDAFWNLGGPSRENLPNVKFSKNEFTPEKDIPILYGNDSICQNNNRLDCGIDIFASIYFMLSRWEEHLVKSRDMYNRFIGKESIAYKSGFLQRPIVNEYIEMLWNMMLHMGYEGKRKERKFEIIPTHDIDLPYMRGRFVRMSKEIVKSLFSLDIKSLPFYFYNYLKDPYDTYNFLMNVSESIGVKSHFYFMSSDDCITEDRPSPYLTSRTRKIIERINKRGHIVGFHPGYFSIESATKWRQEKERITDFLKYAPVEGRQHYLRFNMPDTFSLWENNDMQIDSTLSYHDVEGFRCGTGDIFPVYDFINQRLYNLKERPLIIMDATFSDYQGYSLKRIKEILDYYIIVGRKYKMPLTLLFHNTSFMGYKGYRLKSIYKKCINNL